MQKLDRALEQANIKMDSITNMIAALNCDYGRLEELQDSFDELDEEELAELKELEQIANVCESKDEARNRIEEYALEVQVRSDWYLPNDTNPAPGQFCILLCTGGPAVQIMGELDECGQPYRAWIEYQDWETPWTDRVNESGDMKTLLAYAQCFNFGN